MLAQIAVIPSAPLLVPELAGPSAIDTEPVRAAVLQAGAALAAAADRWVALGVADADGSGDTVELTLLDCPDTGDFGRFGVPVPIAVPHARPADGTRRTAAVPLSALIAGWLGGAVRPAPQEIVPLIVDPRLDSDACGRLGTEVYDRCAGAEPVGLLVVADGANALSPSAPGGGERATAWELQQRLDAGLARGRGEALADLPADECAAEGIGSRAAWQVLAGVLRRWDADRADVRFRGAPFGVGYTVVTLRASEGQA